MKKSELIKLIKETVKLDEKTGADFGDKTIEKYHKEAAMSLLKRGKYKECVEKINKFLIKYQK